MDKLEVYAGLSIAEVWFWENAEIVPYILVGSGYERRSSSDLLPSLDLAQLSGVVREATDQTGALKRYRSLLQTR